MKRLYVLLAVILMLVLIWPAAALAEEEETPSPTDNETTVAISLEIDNEHVFEGNGQGLQGRIHADHTEWNSHAYIAAYCKRRD